LESLKLYPESFGTSYEEQRRLPKLRLEEAIEQSANDRFVIGAFDQDDLIGICAYLPFVPDDVADFSNAGTIIQMYVRSTYSGQKIGLNLTKATIRQAFKVSDVDQIVLGVREGNISAIRVYEQAGFRSYKLVLDEDVVSSEFRIMLLQRDN
jgi:RimJ/RimL family protein N-acetyltransferase